MGELRFLLGLANLPKIRSDAFSTRASSSLNSKTSNFLSEDAAAAEEDDVFVARVIEWDRVDSELERKLIKFTEKRASWVTFFSAFYFIYWKENDNETGCQESSQSKPKPWLEGQGFILFFFNQKGLYSILLSPQLFLLLLLQGFMCVSRRNFHICVLRQPTLYSRIVIFIFVIIIYSMNL